MTPYLAMLASMMLLLLMLLQGKEQHDYLFKFIIIGDAGAGKSCLLHQFIENKCTFNQIPTVAGVALYFVDAS